MAPKSGPKRIFYTLPPIYRYMYDLGTARRSSVPKTSQNNKNFAEFHFREIGAPVWGPINKNNRHLRSSTVTQCMLPFYPSAFLIHFVIGEAVEPSFSFKGSSRAFQRALGLGKFIQNCLQKDVERGWLAVTEGCS